MISISHKAKQFLILLIKLLIVGGSFYFIYNQLANNDKLDWEKFIILFKKNQSVAGISFILLLSVLNRFFEILKWQNLVSYLHKISLPEATKQVLGALTAGLFTPNGVGEYAGKALFFEKLKTKKVIFLNLICNGIQMILSVFFGTIGLWVLGYGFWVSVIGSSGFAIWLLFFGLKKFKIKGYSIEMLIHKINEIPKSIQRINNDLDLANDVDPAAAKVLIQRWSPIEQKLKAFNAQLLQANFNSAFDQSQVAQQLRAADQLLADLLDIENFMTDQLEVGLLKRIDQQWLYFYQLLIFH